MLAERRIQNEERMEFNLMFFDKIQTEYEIPEDMRLNVVSFISSANAISINHMFKRIKMLLLFAKALRTYPYVKRAWNWGVKLRWH